MIAIVNYGVGNLKSISKALETVGAKVSVTSDPEKIKCASGVVFPGVGAFKSAIEKLNLIRDVIDSLEVPILGICLGMQLFATESTEGGVYRGLDYIPGRVVRFPPSVGKVPHMGWNTLKITREAEILDGVESGEFVYFVHSYYMQTDDEFVISKTDYGIDFPSGVERENYIGFQFHPEKSGKVGLRILENFVNIVKR
ncbi:MULTISPECIES: imidazole glycerol phosphate synthase subunit HisH [Archaeoglobus]|jgi:glutamine amidotransferase|uniref:Imidazole glycerol phosphate synthase subunit HisH n=3 Tax=Archaeoglobus fulgidus TaxID=2234 RepID=HIS5_ARCFU|nr:MULTISPECIES: imidazole glycerol phosphate synthase subunit HisH [Archaeoglobus]O28019.1 RecName: Full=Imidazole glycerol phosphate synthase subunit HisH; AltName: Full=IGP synthase glutaminase subunit; AltName: Full=IGP synthase subunit HisH; AltName: Full=ImGP synthase subunit HisH; Short=IGPS subunit HisH [Archaeoglobus fulgidus DSM 4304]AAB88985.1 imidazoleglycerol-phosphate synthase, subunit H (hisH) [Archaeoglobus fulgidus DSM 4304]AIG99274.1 imidazole glycerol phosphate synthase, gluta